MIEEVRTLLDESSPGFWSDEEIERALNDAQVYIARVLRPRELWSEAAVLQNDTLTISDLLEVLEAKVRLDSGAEVPLVRRGVGEYFALKDNTFAQAYWQRGDIVVTNVSPVGTFYVNYLKRPQKLSSSQQNCDLNEEYHPLMCRYAFSQMAIKDGLAIGEVEYKKFLEELRSMK